MISIHAPREGSDQHDFDIKEAYPKFQSTLPVRGATALHYNAVGQLQVFQSTLPVRGATTQTPIKKPCSTFQSTLPVRGATEGGAQCRHCRLISIHAPREGSDWAQRLIGEEFLSISIHAPREGSDYSRTLLRGWEADFNPRSP